MYKIRVLNDEDYSTLKKWWKFWRFPSPPKEYLPEEGKGGIMLTKNGVEVCAGFIFFTNSKMAWVEFIVSNPYYREDDRSELIQSIIIEIAEIIKNKGYKVIFTSVKNESLINHFESVGFMKSANNTTEMILNL